MDDLKKHKLIKKTKVIIEELETLDKILETSLYALKKYHYYIPVAEIMSNINNNKTMIKIHKKHHKEILDRYSKSE